MNNKHIERILDEKKHENAVFTVKEFLKKGKDLSVDEYIEFNKALDDISCLYYKYLSKFKNKQCQEIARRMFELVEKELGEYAKSVSN